MKGIILALSTIKFVNQRLKFSGDAANGDMFGTNFLFNRDGEDRVQVVSNTYDQFVTEAAVATLRYPGGTMTETQFDLENPDSPFQNFLWGSSGGSTTMSLTGFLNYAGAVQANATIVLPTYRFFGNEVDDAGHHVLSMDHDLALRRFINHTLSVAQDNNVRIKAFELGNEWHVRNAEVFGFNMTPVEYGRVASYLSEVVQQEINQFRVNNKLGIEWREPAIAVQVGPGGAAEWYTSEGFRPPAGYKGTMVSATELIFREFERVAEQSAVDAILTHRYLQGGDNLVSGWAYSPFKTWDKLASADPDFKVADRYVTEWNVAADNAGETGLRQFDSLVLLFSEMLMAGVDHANMWAVQQRNPTRLIENSGIGDEVYGGLTFGGLAFDMMSAQLRGQHVMPVQMDSSSLTVAAFGSNDKIVLFLTNRSGSTLTETVSLGEIAPTFHHGMVVEVSASGTSKSDPLGSPDVAVSTDQSRFVGGDVTLEFSTDETIMVVLSRNQSGVYVETYDESSSGAVPQIGSAYNDVFDGGVHDDYFVASGGNDRLGGGMGNDTLSGGSGNDTLNGGAGDDILFGGAGVDIASYASAKEDLVASLASTTPLTVGSFGLDVYSGIEGLEGGSGNDRLIGNRAANILLGGGGSDALNGGSGNDTLNGGAGTDAASYSGSAAGVRVNLALTTAQNTVAAGVDVLISIEDLIGSSFGDVLTGNAHANWISGGAGNDTIAGGAGTDRLDGGDGKDLFLLSAFADHTAQETIVGGSGLDELRFAGAVAGTLKLGAGVDVERVVIGTGTSATAVVTGTAAINIDASDLKAGLVLQGNVGANLLVGSGFADTLYGGSGNDTLTGGPGDDILIGGAGVDVLTGGMGQDEFIFKNAPGGSAASDRITDFASGEDMIHLAALVMSGLVAGCTISDDAFSAGNGLINAQDALDRILYNTTTGAVLYDADGLGGIAAVQIFQLNPGAYLCASDILVI